MRWNLWMNSYSESSSSYVFLCPINGKTTSANQRQLKFRKNLNIFFRTLVDDKFLGRKENKKMINSWRQIQHEWNNKRHICWYLFLSSCLAFTTEKLFRRRLKIVWSRWSYWWICFLQTTNLNPFNNPSNSGLWFTVFFFMDFADWKFMIMKRPRRDGLLPLLQWKMKEIIRHEEEKKLMISIGRERVDGWTGAI